MKSLSSKPLIFLDADTEDAISVQFRVTNHYVRAEFEKLNHPCVKLKDLIEKGSSITYGIVQAGEHYLDGIPMLRVINMESGRQINEGPYELVNPFIASKYKRSSLLAGDILLSIRGSVGKVCYVPERLIGANINQDIAVIRLEDKSDNDFIALYLESDLAKLQMTLHTRGAAVQGINLAELRQVMVPVLSSKEKQNISDRFNTLQKTHEYVFQRCALLISNAHQNALNSIDACFLVELSLASFPKRQNQKVFLCNLTHTERLDIPANHPDYTRLVEQIKSSAAAGVIGDLVEISEARFNPDEHFGQEVHYLAIGDIDGISGKINTTQTMLAEELPSRAKRLIQNGDILVASVSSGDEKTVVFRAGKEQHGWVASTGFHILRPKNGVLPEYIVRLLKAPFILRQYSALTSGSSMPTLSIVDLLGFSVPVTDEMTRKKTLEMINRILSEEKSLVAKLDVISEKIEQLLTQAKANIFYLLEDAKFSGMLAKADELKRAMVKIEEELQ